MLFSLILSVTFAQKCIVPKSFGSDANCGSSNMSPYYRIGAEVWTEECRGSNYNTARGTCTTDADVTIFEGGYNSCPDTGVLKTDCVADFMGEYTKNMCMDCSDLVEYEQDGLYCNLRYMDGEPLNPDCLGIADAIYCPDANFGDTCIRGNYDCADLDGRACVTGQGAGQCSESVCALVDCSDYELGEACDACATENDYSKDGVSKCVAADDEQYVCRNGACSGPVDCTLPASQDGYTLSGASKSITGCNTAICANPVITGVTCASGYTGIVSATCNAITAEAQLTGCNPTVCELPATAPQGFIISNSATITGCSSNGDCANAVINGVTCDTNNGYTGTTITATVCSATDANSTVLGGCAPVTCTLPASQTGYDLSSSSKKIELCTSAACGSVAVTGVTCDASKGYAGTSISANPCSVSNPASTVLTGCALVVCTVPTSQTGYNIAQNAAVASCLAGPNNCNNGAKVTGVTCGTGYTGSTIGYNQCQASNSAITLTGCTTVTCTLPTSQTGYVLTSSTKSISGCTSGSCQSAVVTGVTCATGYTGTRISANKCTTTKPSAVLTGCSAAPSGRDSNNGSVTLATSFFLVVGLFLVTH